MPVISRYTWRRFPPVASPSVGDGVLAPAAFGTVTTVESRQFPQCQRIALPMRLGYPRSYSASPAVTNSTVGARLLRSEKGALVRVFGV